MEYSLFESFTKLNLSHPIPLHSSNRSIVLSVEHSCSHQNLILKCSSQNNKWLFNEVNFLSKFSHPNIVSFVDCMFSSNGLFCLLMERVEGCSLIDLVLSGGSLNEFQVVPIVIQLLEAVSFIHSKGFIHRDLKPDNMIFCPRTGVVKIIDFEFCCRLWRHEFGPLKFNHKHKCGTFEYLAPEVHKGSYGGPKSDVWSLGVSIFILVTGSFPFSQKDLNDKWWMNSEWKVPKVDNLSEMGNDFLGRCLEIDPKERASIDELIELPWLDVGMKGRRRLLFYWK